MYSVLLVDDEPFIVDGLNVLVDWKQLNLLVNKTYNSQDALHIMEHNLIDILITDIKMPKLSGLELIHKAKQLNPQCKCIILSGYNDFEYVKEGIKLGIENYLTKPVNTDELTATLEDCIKGLDSATSKNQFFKDNQAWHLIRGNILSRWVNHTITAEELQNRAELLNIITDSSTYRVAIISIPFKTQSSIQLSKIYQICYHYIASDPSIMSFEDIEGDFVLILTHDFTYYGSTIEELLKNMNDRIKTFGITAHMTVGSNVDSYRDIHKSYSMAKKLFDYFLIYPNKSILSSDLINHQHLTSQLTIEIDHTYIASNLASKNETLLFEYIEQLFEQCVHCDGITPKHLRMMVIEILLNLYTSMSKRSILFHNDIINEHSKLLSKIHQANDLKILKQDLKYLLTFIIKKLKEKEKATSPVVYEIVKYVQKKYFEELSLKTLSYKFNINPTYLGQLFKKETGTSFPNYLNQYRIEKAKAFLMETNFKTAQIAKKVGYMDPNYFYRIFKKYAGVSPTEFKSLR